MNDQDLYYLLTNKDILQIFKDYTRKILQGYKESCVVDKEDIRQDLFLVAIKVVEGYKSKYDTLQIDCVTFNKYLNRSFKNYMINVGVKLEVPKVVLPESEPRVRYPELTDKKSALLSLILDTPEFIADPEYYIKERSGKLNYSRVSEITGINRKTIERTFK
jgi:hypothetical protein